MKIFKKKTRAEIVEAKIGEMLHDILTLEFTNEELAIIVNSLQDNGRIILERRAEELEKELQKTIMAIASLDYKYKM
jgi:DNA-binding transcriptional regulator YhcF (GntR family)